VLRALIELFNARFLRQLSLACLFSLVLAPQAVSFAASEATDQAEHLFQLRNFDEAFDKFKAIQSDPMAASADLALARCRLGIIYSIRDDQKQARSHLELALSSSSLPSTISPLCFYALVQIYVMDRSYAEARDLLKRYSDPVFPATYKARVYGLGSEVGRQLKDSQFEVTQLEKLAKVMDVAGISKVELKILGDWSLSRDDVKQRIGENLKAKAKAKAEAAAALQAAAAQVATPMPSQPAEAVEKAREDQPPPAAVLGENQSMPNSVSSHSAGASSANEQDPVAVFRNFRIGNLQAVITELRNVNASSLVRLNQQLPVDLIRERVDTLLKDDPRHMRVGLVLPLGSGVFSRLQLRALKGLAAFLNSRAANGVDYQVFVKTVANDSGASEIATMDLILKEKVHAIIGPFQGGQVIGAASVAAFFGVPLFALGPVTLAQELDANYIVRMGTLAQSQARAQVSYLKQQNRKTVSIMSPADGYGVEMSKAFEAVCKSEGFQIERVEFVDELSDLFQEPVKSLLGPQDGKHRGPEYAKIVAEARKKAAQEKRKFDPSSIKAPAHVPFTALFVPDSLDRVRLIANTFAFYEARSVRYLGDRTWQEAGGRQSIADQFLNGARVPVQRSGSFLSYLRRELSAGESVLDIERQAFDSLLLSRTAQYKAGGNNPAKLAGVLQSPDFTADGASKYGPIDATGEPAIEFEISQYFNGSVLSPNVSSENLPNISGSVD